MQVTICLVSLINLVMKEVFKTHF